MAQIDHMAVWVENLENMKVFYESYLGARAGDKYTNTRKGFSSYFLHFQEGSRLEIMTRKDIKKENNRDSEFIGWAHLAFRLTSKDEVIALTEKLREDGFIINSEPRTTGDGYFESVILDPEGNRIELTT